MAIVVNMPPGVGTWTGCKPTGPRCAKAKPNACSADGDCGPGLVCENIGGGKKICAPPKRKPKISELHPLFQPVLKKLMARLKQAGLPFVISDAVRTPERQIWARDFSKGSKVGPEDAPHVHGFAVDLRLSPEFTAKHDIPWDGDHGLNYKGDPRTKVVRPIAYAQWAALGSLIKAEFPELRWGGEFGRTGNKIFGWDPWHVELYDERPGGVRYTKLIAEGRGYDDLTYYKMGLAIPVVIGIGVWLWYRRKKR